MTSTTVASKLAKVLNRFFPEGSVASCELYGMGHINKTHLVVTTDGRRYILQQINTRVFRNPAELMENVSMVIEHLNHRAENPRCVLHLLSTIDGQPYLIWEDGSVWRVFDFLENSICLQMPETPEDFYESAVAFGNFQQMLTDFPAEKLHEIIPNFHHTPDRYRLLREALAEDPMHRAAEIQPELEFVLAREQEAKCIRLILTAKRRHPH